MATPREHMARKRAERIEKGLCPCCGKERPREGKYMCQPCADRWYGYNRRWVEKNREKVRAAARAHKKRVAASRIEARLCIICGKNKPHPLRHTCDSCLQKRRMQDYRRYVKKQKDAGDV